MFINNAIAIYQFSQQDQTRVALTAARLSREAQALAEKRRCHFSGPELDHAIWLYQQH
ncbi:hypothetical protein KCP77_22085 [Salmonella enterica subsp. enterica]|nr:hypothetical protein KCP77_22085 [Salmonella enterica subsp. enterica]